MPMRSPVTRAWQDELTVDDLKWLYTAVTRAVDRLWLVNFRDECFDD